MKDTVIVEGKYEDIKIVLIQKNKKLIIKATRKGIISSIKRMFITTLQGNEQSIGFKMED